MTLAKQLFDLIDYGSEGWGFESLQAHTKKKSPWFLAKGIFYESPQLGQGG